MYNWGEYIGESTLANFEKETGIHVELIEYEDEEVVLGALQSGGLEADLVVVSESIVPEMIKAKLLMDIDHSLIPNLVHIDPEYLDPGFDPGLEHSVPYLSGMTGLAVNLKHVSGDSDTWNVLFDEKYAGKIAMLNNLFEVTSVAAKSLGFKLEPHDPGELELVRQRLLEQKPWVKGYYSAVELSDMLESGEIYAAPIYSGDGLKAVDADPDIRFSIPREGGARWVDVFTIPRQSRKSAAACALINYIHRPEVMAAISSELWVAPVNKDAVPLMSKEVRDSPEVFPPADVMRRSEFFEGIGDMESTLIRRRIWTEVTGK